MQFQVGEYSSVGETGYFAPSHSCRHLEFNSVNLATAMFRLAKGGGRWEVLEIQLVQVVSSCHTNIHTRNR